MTDNQRAYEAAICEVAHVDDIGDVSDGFHTFNQLYHQRAMLFAALVNQNRDISWKTRKHEDGEPCFGGGWFLVTIDTPEGAYGYHYEDKYWDMFHCKELEKAKHWDGYTEEDVGRLMSLPVTATSAANLIDRDALMKEICNNECGCVCDEECENVMCNYYGYIMMDAPIIKANTAEEDGYTYYEIWNTTSEINSECTERCVALETAKEHLETKYCDWSRPFGTGIIYGVTLVPTEDGSITMIRTTVYENK